MEKVGKEGVITVEEGTGLENELSVVEGMRSTGLHVPYFVNSRKNHGCRAGQPADLLVTKDLQHPRMRQYWKPCQTAAHC